MTNASSEHSPAAGSPPASIDVGAIIPRSEADIPTLVAILDQAMIRLREIAPDDVEWGNPTPCAGWAVSDIYAHIIDLELTMAGEPVSTYEPDWAELPHVKGDFQRLTERGVAERRSWSREQMLSNFDQIRRRRQEQLIEGNQDPAAETLGPFGAPFPLERVLRMRILDCWVHEQDIRTAIDQPGDWGTPAAWITAGSMVGGLGFVLGKRLGASPGTTLRIAVTGPAVRFSATVMVGPNNRGMLVGTAQEPTAAVELSWPEFMRLSAGRGPAFMRNADRSGVGGNAEVNGAAADAVRTSGDLRLAEQFLAGLAVLP